jgi:hypothetical protein
MARRLCQACTVVSLRSSHFANKKTQAGCLCLCNRNIQRKRTAQKTPCFPRTMTTATRKWPFRSLFHCLLFSRANKCRIHLLFTRFHTLTHLRPANRLPEWQTIFRLPYAHNIAFLCYSKSLCQESNRKINLPHVTLRSIQVPTAYHALLLTVNNWCSPSDWLP